MASIITDLKAIPKNSRVVLGVSASWFFSAGLVSSWKNLFINMFGGFLLVGAISTVSLGLGLLFSFLGGHLGAAYSEKKIVVTSILVTAIGYALFALASTVEILALGIVLMTFSSLGAPCLNSIYFGEVQREHRGLASGTRTVAVNVAAFTAPIVSTHVLLSLLGFVGMMRMGLLLTAICLIINSGVVALLVRPNKGDADAIRKTPKSKQLFLDGLHTTLRTSPALRILLVVTILESVGYSISTTYEIFVVTGIVGVTIDAYSILLLIYGVLFIPLGFIFGRYADRVSRWRCALGFLLLPFINLALIFSRGFWQLLIILMSGAVGIAAWYASKYPLITDLTPREKLASVFAVFLTLPSLFAFFVPFLSSLILLSFPLEALWMFEVCIFSSAAALVLLAYRFYSRDFVGASIQLMD
ncbi:MAG: MFS transporter [Promethearchaeota archaeon]